MYSGVPEAAAGIPAASPPRGRAEPKSASHARPAASRRMFDGLMSPCAGPPRRASPPRPGPPAPPAGRPAAGRPPRAGPPVGGRVGGPPGGTAAGGPGPPGRRRRPAARRGTPGPGRAPSARRPEGCPTRPAARRGGHRGRAGPQGATPRHRGRPRRACRAATHGDQPAGRPVGRRLAAGCWPARRSPGRGRPAPPGRAAGGRPGRGPGRRRRTGIDPGGNATGSVRSSGSGRGVRRS